MFLDINEHSMIQNSANIDERSELGLTFFYLPILIVVLIFYIIQNPRAFIRNCQNCVTYSYKGITSFVLGNIYSDVMNMINLNDNFDNNEFSSE